MITAPSPRQMDLLRAVEKYQRAMGFAPTNRELCELLEVRSTNGVAEMIRALERKGLLMRTRGCARTLLLTSAGQRQLV